MNYPIPILMAVWLAAISFSCQKASPEIIEPTELSIQYARLGTESILHGSAVSPTGNIVIGFSKPIGELSGEFFQLSQETVSVEVDKNWSNDRKEISIINPLVWSEGKNYQLIISSNLQAADGGEFPGDTLYFSTTIEPLSMTVRSKDGTILQTGTLNTGIPLEPEFELLFSHPVPEDIVLKNMEWPENGSELIRLTPQSDSSYSLTTLHPLEYYTSYDLTFRQELSTATGRPFEERVFDLFTELDSSYKFPELTDEELLTLVQRQTFKYFWEGADQNSGMALERNSSGTTVTTGGTGFGLMAMIVAVERGFISRMDALNRWAQIFNFLKGADRFHGAWSHWIDGATGKVRPFSPKDNGADLVETAFLIQGMLTVRQYLNPSVPEEKELIDLIDELWLAVEWDWFTKSGEKVLYWHWSPQYEWEINLPIRGHNETHIIYVLAASSADHGISKGVYDEGYARSGNMKNGKTYYDITLPLGPEKGGPLFFTHYSYLGLDPRKLTDEYANYWKQNVNHSRINRAYCIENPNHYIGYSSDCWGLTASDGYEGYSAHSPTNDRGVITPTAAISSLPYTPEESMDAIRHFYYILGDRLWGEYGFYDAFNITEEWVADSYLAIDQGPIICMIENYRTGLLWDLFMSTPEVQSGLEKLNINYE